MTAEIGILNKAAVALAADSAVTIGSKVYKTANKLFELSEVEPVGLMIYGNAEFMDIPWETIIKTFRSDLGTCSYQSLFEYADRFFAFLEDHNEFFPAERQESYFRELAFSNYHTIREQIDSRVKEHIDEEGKISRDQTRNIIEAVVDERFNEIIDSERVKGVEDDFVEAIKSYYGKTINSVIKDVFEKLPLGKKAKEQLKHIPVAGSVTWPFPRRGCGVVIAGFGTEDVFPALIASDVHCIIQNKLIRKERRRQRIDTDCSASIMPFAQSEMVSTFMEGVDPDYQRIVEASIKEILRELPKSFMDYLPDEDSSGNRALRDKVVKASQKLDDYVTKQLAGFRRAKYINPIVNAVSVLPKNELAEMAESLVSLTSFKRRMSLDHLETVGGAIDVAVISKGDGFVWIKRKHYFEPELNQRFLARLAGRCQRTQQDNDGGEHGYSKD